MLYTIIIIVSSIIFVITFFYIWTIEDLENNISKHNMNIAMNLGNYPYFGDLLQEEDPAGMIQNYTYKQLEDMENVDMLVVANMDGKRFSHPRADRLGKYFVGGDEKRVIELGEQYISFEEGTLGQSLRAFAPIHNTDGKQVGFIMVGTLLEGIEKTQRITLVRLLVYSLGGLILGIVGSIILSGNIKKSLLGLEPHQISMLYIEKNSMLEAIQEGIISIDKDKKITMINDSARRILGITKRNPIGERIYNIFPNNELENVLETGVPKLGEENNLSGVIIVTNIVPILNNGKVIGVLASFRDKTELARLGEEITGFKEVFQSLRASTHEYQNKLHVILGLIQIGEIEHAKKYILESNDDQQQLVLNVMKKINNPVVSGLLAGKISRAKELGVQLDINNISSLETNGDRLRDIAIVIILGNLIENALEAAAIIDNDNKRVSLIITESEHYKKIIVSDNGIGIKNEDISILFERGFSTNSSQRGYGLALVKDKVESLSGEINVKSDIGIGTTFEVILPKGEDI